MALRLAVSGARARRRSARRRRERNRPRTRRRRELEGVGEHVVRVGARQVLRAVGIARGDGGEDGAVLGHARGEPLGQIERAEPQHQDLRIDGLEELAQHLVASGGEDQVVEVDGGARVRLDVDCAGGVLEAAHGDLEREPLVGVEPAGGLAGGQASSAPRTANRSRTLSTP
jgi:hypothetical protein